MNPIEHNRSRRNQSGSVMLIALIMLVAVGTLGLLSMQTSKLETRMAGNEQVRVSAHQTAQALVDVVLADPTLTQVVGTVGFINCTAAEVGCSRNTLTMPAGIIATEVASGYLGGRVEYTDEGPPPRIFNSSSESLIANHYLINSTYDRADQGQGRSGVTQGLIILTQNTL